MIKLNDSDKMREYLVGVLKRADHHAQRVEACVMAVFGAVIAYKDEGTSIEVKELNGEMVNVLWAQINGTRYAFSYNGNEKIIEMREKSTRGPVVISFDDTCTLQQIRTFFADLKTIY